MSRRQQHATDGAAYYTVITGGLWLVGLVVAVVVLGVAKMSAAVVAALSTKGEHQHG